MTHHLELNETMVRSLTRIRDLISDEDNAFSIQHGIWKSYTIHPVDSYKGECGTPACIAGWSHTLDSEYMSAIASVNRGLHGQLFCPNFNDYISFLDTPEYFTREKTVKVLDHLITTGELDWTL